MSAFFNRGSSVLAALLLVGALAVVTLGMQALSGPQNPQSQSAQAAVPLPQARPAAAGPNASEVDKKCQDLKKEAAAAGSKSKDVVQQFQKDTKEQNFCIGAVFDPTSAAGKLGKRDNPEAYKCVGEKTKITMDAKGQGTITSSADETVTKEMCETTVCTADGKCGPAKLVSGGVGMQSWVTSNPTMLNGLPPETQKAVVANLGPLDATQQTQLQQAFLGQLKDTNSQVLQAQQEVSDAQAQLDGIARACGESTGDDACTKKMQEQQAVVDQKTADLAQLEKLKDDQAQLVDPTKCKTERCASEEIGVYEAPKQCPSGQTGTYPDCKSDSRCTFAGAPGCGGGGGGGGGGEKPSGSGGGLGSILQSLLGSLAKGLGSSAANTGPACSSDPNAYAQQQQQYNAQMQQYNYQLQQCNFQQQLSQLNGLPAPIPPAAPQACQQTSNSNTCPAAPAQPAASGCQNGTWKPVTTQQSNGYQCTSSWQCVPGGGIVPTAQISCQPQVADVGMSIAISYSCGNATGSTGQGFDTGNQTSGSTTTVISTPPAGATGANFSLNCTNQGTSARAECSVQIGRPTIVLVANPKIVDPGAASTIGWITSGMQSCVVSSPELSQFTADNAGNTSVNGMASTTALTTPVHILLHCVTIGGGTRDATTTIGVVGQPDISDTNPSNGSVTVTSNADGALVARGDTVDVSWTTANPPAGSHVALWLYDVRLGLTTALIQTALAASSTYAWHLPSAGDTCDATSNLVCDTDLIPGREYGIEAALYTDTSDPLNPNYLDYGFTPDSFTISS